MAKAFLECDGVYFGFAEICTLGIGILHLAAVAHKRNRLAKTAL